MTVKLKSNQTIHVEIRQLQIRIYNPHWQAPVILWETHVGYLLNVIQKNSQHGAHVDRGFKMRFNVKQTGCGITAGKHDSSRHIKVVTGADLHIVEESTLSLVEVCALNFCLFSQSWHLTLLKKFSNKNRQNSLSLIQLALPQHQVTASRNENS